MQSTHVVSAEGSPSWACATDASPAPSFHLSLFFEDVVLSETWKPAFPAITQPLSGAGAQRLSSVVVVVVVVGGPISQAMPE
jgi:hypothetical protein